MEVSRPSPAPGRHPGPSVTGGTTRPRETPGRRLTFCLPGVIRFDGLAGRYRALSITGTTCALQCDHCRGLLLRSMDPVPTPSALERLAIDAGVDRIAVPSDEAREHGRKRGLEVRLQGTCCSVSTDLSVEMPDAT